MPPPAIAVEGGSYVCSEPRMPIDLPILFRERFATVPVPIFGLEPPTKILSWARAVQRTRAGRQFDPDVVRLPVHRGRPQAIISDRPKKFVRGRATRLGRSAIHVRVPHNMLFDSYAGGTGHRAALPCHCKKSNRPVVPLRRAVCWFVTLRAAVARIAQRCASSTSFQPVGALGRAARHVCSHQPA